MSINRPVKNTEDVEQARASHDFDPQFGRCIDCDCRPWGAIATWPCGTRVPREIAHADGTVTPEEVAA